MPHCFASLRTLRPLMPGIRIKMNTGLSGDGGGTYSEGVNRVINLEDMEHEQGGWQVDQAAHNAANR